MTAKDREELLIELVPPGPSRTSADAPMASRAGHRYA